MSEQPNAALPEWPMKHVACGRFEIYVGDGVYVRGVSNSDAIAIHAARELLNAAIERAVREGGARVDREARET